MIEGSTIALPGRRRALGGRVSGAGAVATGDRPRQHAVTVF